MTDELLKPAVHTRPVRRIVLDVETTGLQRYDRIVSLGAVRIEGNQLLLSRALHLVFDPRTDSHPDALRVHGWDDWTMRFQDLFADLAPAVRKWLAWADEVVCHNAGFDMHYVAREIRKAELEPLGCGTLCTMEDARSRWPGEPASLDHCISRFGMSRVGPRHGALEDALLTAGFFLAARGATPRLPPLNTLPGPRNFVAPPARPEGPLPRREAKRPGQSPTIRRLAGG
jgi:DNA polymerase-3 subunit epsilon